jgi:hypothetical protein
MEQYSGSSLDWFFQDLLHSDRRIDLAVKNVGTKGDAANVTIKNKTKYPLPVIINAYNKDTVTATVTTLPFKGDTTITVPISSDWKRLRLSPSMGDMKTQNNEYRRSGLFHRSGLQLRPLAGTNSSSYQKLFVLPALGFNVYDGFGAGLLFHNITMPENKFRFILAPLYSLRSKSFTGMGSIAYVAHPEKAFQEITVQADVKSFNYDESAVNISKPLFARYLKIAPSLNFVLKESKFTSPVVRSILLKGYAISEDYFIYNQNPVDSLFRPAIATQSLYYGLVRYSHKNNRTFNPFSYTAEMQMGKEFAKLTAEASIRIDYHIKKKSLYVRAFAGKFFSFNDASLATDRYHLNSTYSGVNDYLYDDTYIGRSEREGFSAHQISMREGGLKIPTPFLASPLGRNDNWLAAVNIKTDLPIKLPIRLFADIATFSDAAKLNPSANKILFDAGVEIHAFDVLNIYIPLIMSPDYQDYMKTIIVKDRFLKSITFSLQLDKIKWLNGSSEVFKLAGY